MTTPSTDAGVGSDTPRTDAAAMAGMGEVWVTAEFARASLERPLVALGTAIAGAAHRASIYNGEVPLNGAQLVQLCFDMADEIVRLRSAISEAQSFALTQRTAEALDAERYRYLRSAAGQYKEDDCGPMVCSGCGDNFEFLRGEEVDSEVDDAMALWKAAGSPVFPCPQPVITLAEEAPK